MFNRFTLLKAIRSLGPVSRTELIAHTRLSGGTVTEITTDLLRRNLISETRTTAKGRGRPRAMLEVNAGGRTLVSVSFTPDARIRVSFVDLQGTILFEAASPIDTVSSLDALSRRIGDVIEVAIGESTFSHAAIARVALAMPGLVDSVSGEVHWMATFLDDPFAIVPVLAQRLGVPVSVQNETNVLALAEHWFGRARQVSTFSLILFDSMTTLSRFVDGFVAVGANGFNPEFGHIKIDLSPAARPCMCGQAGCLTAYASSFAVVDPESFREGLNTQTIGRYMDAFGTLLALAEDGDADVRARFTEAGRYLGTAAANHINVNDPGLLYVMATDQRTLDLLAPGFFAGLRAALFPGMRTRVEFGVASEGWRERGCAALALEQVYLDDRDVPAGAT